MTGFVGGWSVPGFVYVMECGGLYKIGWTRTPTARLKQIQTGNPFPVTLIGVIEGTHYDEATWQETFADQHERGEWFRLTEADVARILHEDTGFDTPPEDEFHVC